MSVVRLELTVADGDAEKVAADLVREFCGPVQDLDSMCEWTNPVVAILTDAGEKREWVVVKWPAS